MHACRHQPPHCSTNAQPLTDDEPRRISWARVLKSGLIIAEDKLMSNPPHHSQIAASVSAQPSQNKPALQQKLLESVMLLRQDVRSLTHEWQARKTHPLQAQQLADIEQELLVPLDALVEELSRPEGPDQARVEAVLNALVGAQGMPAPLTRLQGFTPGDAQALPLDEQRVLSKINLLAIEMNGLRAQWQDYLALQRPEAAASASPPPPATKPAQRSSVAQPSPRHAADPIEGVEAEEPRSSSSDVPPPALPKPVKRRRPGGWAEMGDLLRALLPILLALLVIAFVAFELLGHLPGMQGQPATAEPHLTQPPHPAATIQLSPTSAPIASVVASQPPGAARLSVTPSVLALSCPATGEALLQLTNSGAVALDWVATISSPSGTDPGILLDGEPSETGHLNPGEVFEISVTAQARQAQGVINIRYSGASSALQVPYSVDC